MKYAAFAILTVHTVVIWIGTAIGLIINRPFFEAFGIPAFFGALPFLNFVVSVAFVFVFPNTKMWRVAAVINSIPVGLLVLLFTIFFLGGYHG